MTASQKKTPSDATDFEREQLRFLLGRNDLTATLVEFNPSLAWLPILGEMKLIREETQLAPWIERNFASLEAIRDIAANIRFFGPETADILEFRLNREPDGLSPLLMKSWRLVIRYMKLAKRGSLQREWIDIAPRIKRGELSPEVIQRLVDLLTPQLQIGKRLSLYEDKAPEAPQRPSDLMTIDYEIEDDVNEREVLSVWPVKAPPAIDEKLLRMLTHSLTVVLEEAVDAGVESDATYSLSDTDVPSVAAHIQNAYRSGFLTIVRVMAEVWSHLAKKDPALAIPQVRLWKASPFRLSRRLAIYAAADPAVPAELAAEILILLPSRELFLTNSSVEVSRLIRIRWADFSPQERTAIEERLIEGPPADSFSEDAERDQYVDRQRFDVLGDMQRQGLALSPKGIATLNEIRRRFPNWQLRPAEQAGFHIWHQGSSAIVGDSTKLANVPDSDLVATAKRAADKADFMEGDSWQALCQSDPLRALRGLQAHADSGQWPAWAWNPFLWATQKIEDPASHAQIARLLLLCPEDQFSEIAASASWWLDDKARVIEDALLWPLWDRIEEAAPRSTNDRPAMRDYLTDALSDPAGRLAEVLIKKIAWTQSGSQIPDEIGMRLDKLITALGTLGLLARVRLAAEVSFLYDRAPAWTQKNIVPMFNWSSPEAGAMWSARQYSNYIGSPELIRLTKEPFLALFNRDDTPEEELSTYSDWLAAMILANQAHDAGYPITGAEARTTLRRAGPRSLSNIGHRLSVEMESAKADEKLTKWRNVVGPVFQAIWPLDVELQTPSSTFKLVQILRASGNAFPEAAQVIIPFIRPEDPRGHTSIYSISEADDLLYASSPEQMLDLLTAAVGETPTKGLYGLQKALERLRSHAPHLAETKKFQTLLNAANLR